MSEPTEEAKKARLRVYHALLEDLADGNIPGSEFNHGEHKEHTIWIHTDANIKAWLFACLNDGVGELDDWGYDDGE